MRIEECLEKSRFEAQGSIVLNGQPIPYRTVCEDNFFVDEEGQPTATIFSYAYFRSDVADPSTRPVFVRLQRRAGMLQFVGSCRTVWPAACEAGRRAASADRAAV